MTSLDPRTIAKIMGGDALGRDSVNVPGPNHSAADRSLSIKINSRAPGGFVVYSHCGDDPIECRDYVRQRLNLGAFSPETKYSPTPLSVTIGNGDKDIQRRKDFAQTIWQQSSNPTGTIVEKYLRDERCLELSPEIANSVVRFHGHLRYGDQTLPGMVLLMRSIATDEPCGIHRTFLNKDGQKIDRRMLGVAKGAAIKIDAQPSFDGRLTIGEGFETTHASKLADLGPAWALGSAGAIASFPVIDTVKDLTILGENDPASRRAVRAVKDRYLKSRRRVTVVTPRRGLTDFNDVWREAQNQ